jgi:TatD DNase family protein
MSVLIDSHCHLDFDELSADLDGVLARAADAGVVSMITISTRVRRFDRIRALIDAHPQIFGSVGTHCQNAAEEDDVTLDEIVALAGHPKVVAIGEAGLDYHYDLSPRDAQERGFRKHIAAARMTGLPLVIHAREADDDVAAILEDEMGKGPFTAVLHCFSSGAELAARGVALGLYVSFSGILTFKNSQTIRDIAASVPRDRLLVETDAPYLAPMPYRGKRNEPAYVAQTARVLADTIGVSMDEIARLTTANTLRLFNRLPAQQFQGAAA